jgi:predicted aldo/keto reductase-like oxidoreductase
LSGYSCSALGFGCMRLPTVNGQFDGLIDEGPATALLHAAIDHGVNYLDTAYLYHAGQSEPFLGRALQGGYRARVQLATKLPCHIVSSLGDCTRIFQEQLERLQTDHVDVYLLHGLNLRLWHQMQDLGVPDWLDALRASKQVGTVGFSFHDSYPAFREIVDAYDWQVCQIQYNYLNEQFQAGTAGLQYAAANGLAVVVMEPLLGGKLASPPQAVRAVLDASPFGYSPAEWAFRWVLDHQAVSVVLSGMGTPSQVEENVAIASNAYPGAFSAEERHTIDAARDAYRTLLAGPDNVTGYQCTGCSYCMPCPQGVDIPRTFALLNDVLLFTREAARREYQTLPTGGDACVQCQQCEGKCPQSIPVSKWIPFAHEVLHGPHH